MLFLVCCHSFPDEPVRVFKAKVLHSERIWEQDSTESMNPRGLDHISVINPCSDLLLMDGESDFCHHPCKAFPHGNANILVLPPLGECDPEGAECPPHGSVYVQCAQEARIRRGLPLAFPVY